jgi:hypothetical protein
MNANATQEVFLHIKPMLQIAKHLQRASRKTLPAFD